MIKIAIPFTGEIVLNTASYAEYQHDEVAVNTFDEVRERLELSIKYFNVEDIALFMISLKCPESVLINMQINDVSWLMIFTLSGSLTIQPVEGNHFSLMENSYHNIWTEEHTQAELIITGEVQLFVVCLTGETFNKLLAEERDAIWKNRAEKKHDLLQPRIITSAMYDVLNPVIHYANNKALHRIFLAAKMLELVYLNLKQIHSDKPSALPGVKPGDWQKLEKAKKIIAGNLQAPCSLIELAHKVGLNDFKLKKGFREVFGTTVFGYLFDLRMEKARDMLLSSKFTIGEVAGEVGYKNAQHFTTAYKKKFGYLPSKTNYVKSNK